MHLSTLIDIPAHRHQDSNDANSCCRDFMSGAMAIASSAYWSQDFLERWFLFPHENPSFSICGSETDFRKKLKQMLNNNCDIGSLEEHLARLLLGLSIHNLPSLQF